MLSENNNLEFLIQVAVVMAAQMTQKCICVTSDQWCYSPLPDAVAFHFLLGS